MVMSARFQVTAALLLWKDRPVQAIYERVVPITFIVWREERKPTRCNNIDGLLSIMDVDY